MTTITVDCASCRGTGETFLHTWDWRHGVACATPIGCTTCAGTGHFTYDVRCERCHDRGEYPVNRGGDHDGFEWCDCEAGQDEYAAFLAEAAAVDAEAHDQHRAAAAWHAAEDAREAALPTPDLHAQPF